MKWFKLFKQYQRKKIFESKISYLMIIFSIVISTTIAIAIPQINQSTKIHIEKSATVINGADLKVSTDSVISKKFVDKIEELKNDDIIDVNINKVYQQMTKHNNNSVLYNLISSSSIPKDSIIMSKSLSDQLGLKVNDTFSINEKDYSIYQIDQNPIGVDQASEQIGYCKISDEEIPNSNYLTNNIYLINTSDTQNVKNILKDIEGNYSYTTVDEQKAILSNTLNTSIMSLELLNTLCVIMTLIAVATSVFLIITQRKKDIAVMKCLSIPTNDIKKSLRFEMKIILIIPIAIGTVLSRLVANYLLYKQGIELHNNTDALVKGFIFFIIAYFVFIDIATLNISEISPLSFFKDNKDEFNFKKLKIIIISGLYLFLVMLIYSIFCLNNIASFASSLVIIILSLVFYFITKILIKLLSLFKSKGLSNYTKNNLLDNSSSFCLFIISSALLTFLILFGFTFEKTMGDSYNKDIEQQVGYNYIMSVTETADITSSKLNQVDSVEKYSLLYITDGVIINSNNSTVKVRIGNIEQSAHNISFKILEGKNFDDCANNEVLVSKNFIEKNNLTLNENMSIYKGNIQYFEAGKYTTYTVVGVYDSKGVNDNLFIQNSNNTNGINMYLITAKNDEFLNLIDNAYIINTSLIGNMLQNQVGRYLMYFRILCFICIISSLIFNFNILYMRYFNNLDIIIGQALGKYRSFYYKFALIKNIMSFIISSLLSIILYVLIAYQILKLLNINMVLSIDIFIIPLVCILLLDILYYLLEIYFIKKYSSDYILLRERN